MAGILGEPAGSPSPAHPLGAPTPSRVSAPMTAGVGLQLPDREPDPTGLPPAAAFQTEAADPSDEPPIWEPLSSRSLRLP